MMFLATTWLLPFGWKVLNFEKTILFALIEIGNSRKANVANQENGDPNLLEVMRRQDSTSVRSCHRGETATDAD